MPGLLRGMARTAVVAGTATAVSNRVSRRQAKRWGAQDAAAAPEPLSSRSAGRRRRRDRVEQLKELAALKDQGVLTDEEFAAEKANVLAS